MIPHLRLHRNNLPLIQTPLTIAIENRITPEQAQSNLFSAIDFADENEFATLCDAAISHGANVNTNNVFGQHPIACAILRGSLPILRCLFARGALTPNPDANGYDIVMIAALSNHADVMEFLITDGNMLNDAKDIQGMTALHIAASLGNTEVIKILLKYGASPDTLTSRIRDNTLQKIFNQNLNEFDIFTNGKNITPLMIATALKDYVSVNLLLKYRAKIDLGAVPPLVIALKKNDLQMIEILSRAGAYSDQSPALKDIGLIEYAIKNNIAAECIECLLNENSGKINLTSQQILNLLAYSIKKDRPDYLALLLATGMNPENDHQFQHLCANAHQTQNKIFIHNMLASLNADDFEEKINSENIQSISELFGVILNTYNLIQMGIFPPVTNKILQVFSRAKSANRENNEEQMNFSLAVALGKGDLLNKKLFPDDFLNHNGNHIASEWITEVKKKAELQFTLLHKISNEVIDEKFIEFQELVSIDYLKEHIQSKKNAYAIFNIIESTFINEIGLPNDLANLIALVFRSGFNFTLALELEEYQQDERALLTQKLIINLLNYSKVPPQIIANNVSAKFTEKLSFFLNEDGRHLNDFYSNPFFFIKKIENRHNLRPPEVNTLLKQLSLDLGLPPQFSQYLVKAWSNSIINTRQLNNLHIPSAIALAHKHQFSLSLLDELEIMSNNLNFSNEKFLEHTCQQLKNWCIKQLPQAEIYTGKRHASDNVEPSVKRQRQQ